MTASPIDGNVSPGNPLSVFYDIADDAATNLQNDASHPILLACKMLGDTAAAKRTPDAFAFLCGSLAGLIEEMKLLAREAGIRDVSTAHAGEFLWVQSFDAYNYACDAIGDNAERRHPLSFAHLVVGFYSAWISNMRMQLPMKGGVLQ